MTPETSKPSPMRFNPWPVSIIAFFTVAIIGCGSFVAFCSRHPADLVAADYYEQELRYQGQIDGLQRARQRAQTTAVTYDAKARLISIALPPFPAESRPTGKIQLYRPSATNQDRQFTLEPNADGVQTIDTSNLLPGLWKVRVTWTVAHEDYFVDQQIVLGSKSS